MAPEYIISFYVPSLYRYFSIYNTFVTVMYITYSVHQTELSEEMMVSYPFSVSPSPRINPDTK